MSFFIGYYLKGQVVVYDGNKIIVTAKRRSTFLGKIFYKFYLEDILVLECSYTASILSSSMKVVTNESGEYINIIKDKGKYYMHYNEHAFYIARNFRGILNFSRNPIYKLYNNDIESGQISYVKKISFGGGIHYKIDFNQKDDTTIPFQLMFCIMKLLQFNSPV